MTLQYDNQNTIIPTACAAPMPRYHDDDDTECHVTLRLTSHAMLFTHVCPHDVCRSLSLPVAL